MCPCRAGTARRSCWTKTSGVSARRSSFTDETVEFGHLQDRLDQQGVDVDADSDAYVRPHVGPVSCDHAHHGCGARLLHANPVCGEFKANPMWPWLYGAILLMFGLIIIAFHQYWRSLAAVIVSVVGWVMAARGVILLTVPQAYSAAGNAVYSSGATAAIWVVFICPGLGRALPDLRRLETATTHATRHGQTRPRIVPCRG